MIPSLNRIETIELDTVYNIHTVKLPTNSNLLDLVHRSLHGHETLTLIYETDDNTLQTSDFELIFNSISYSYNLDKSYKYLATVKDTYSETHSIVHWRRVLTEEEKRELKIDHLLTQ